MVIVESDRPLARLMLSFLSRTGASLTWYDSAEQAAGRIDSSRCDVAVIDTALAGKDGFALLTSLRRKYLQLPIVLLTENDRVQDRLRGLRSGADDCLAKPFDLEELAARIAALFRRVWLLRSAYEPVHLGNLQMDVRNREANVAGYRLDLPPKEYAVLDYLIRKRGSLLTKQEIIERVWGYRFSTGTNILEVTVSRLRAKLLRASAEVRIRTVYGKGYLIETM